MERRNTSQVVVKDIAIGGGAPISVQSMTCTDTRDVKATCEQIKRLQKAGCDIVRLAVVDQEAADAIGEIRKQVDIPLVADIHFDYRLALACMKNGVDKVRINPGNIGDRDRVRQVVQSAKERKIPIRIGINTGSLEKEVLAKYGSPCAQAMVESAKKHIEMLEAEDFYDIVVSLKASDVMKTIEAYRLMADTYTYPLHLGVTEAGTMYGGTIKSSIGIGTLLAEGIGDTIRVSLTADPVQEVVAGQKILKALGLRKEGINLVSCPTCGRCRVNVIDVASRLEQKIESIPAQMTVAVMGCAVNGPGEAREADIGIAGGNGEFLLFKKGEIVEKIPMDGAVERLAGEIEKMAEMYR